MNGYAVFSQEFIATFRLGLAVGIFLFGLLTVFPTTHSIFWAPSILVSEWGHLGALLPLCLIFGNLRLVRSRLALVFAVGALGLLLSPLLRALNLAEDIPDQLAESFGEALPLSSADAPARTGVVTGADLFRFSSPRGDRETMQFKPGLTLDLYRRNELSNRLPIVIVVHGGSWQHGDSNQIPGVNHYLARRGYAVAAINYRKAPIHPFPAARDDVVAAIQYLKTHAEKFLLDADRIVLMGRSAGGQLVLVVAYSLADPSIKGVVSLYAPTDMFYSWENPGNPMVIDAHKLLTDYLGGSPVGRGRVYRRASPLALAHALVPPTLLFHGGRDEMVWPAQSERLRRRLEHLSVNHLMIRLGWGEHGFDANLWGPGGQIYLYALERFLAAVFAP